MNSRAIRWAVVLSTLAGTTQATELELRNQFNPSGVGQIIGLTYDPVGDRVWTYGGSVSLNTFTPDGTLDSTLTRPGGSANDADLDYVNQAFQLNGIDVPAGAILYFDGEVGETEVYAVQNSDGTLIASLDTAFGMSHVVGGAYHPLRNTLFLVQDTVPTGTENDSVVAEIDPSDGSVLNTFKIDSVLTDFTVFFGDVDVHQDTGNLWIVSSNESRVAEFTPDGSLVQTRDLPGGVSGLSGIGLDEAAGRLWVSSSSGVVSELGLTLIGDTDGDGDIDDFDLLAAISSFTGSLTPGSGGQLASDGDTDGDGDVDDFDLLAMISGFTGSLPAATSNVPEPGTLALLSIPALLVVRRRRS